MTIMTYTTPTQRISDLESEVFQGTHHVQRLSADVAILKEQGKLHGELLADAMTDLRDLRVDLAEFKSEVRARFDKQGAQLDKQGAQLEKQGVMLDALLAHFGIELPAAANAASS